ASVVHIRLPGYASDCADAVSDRTNVPVPERAKDFVVDLLATSKYGSSYAQANDHNREHQERFLADHHNHPLERPLDCAAYCYRCRMDVRFDELLLPQIGVDVKRAGASFGRTGGLSGLKSGDNVRGRFGIVWSVLDDGLWRRQSARVLPITPIWRKHLSFA